MNPSSPHPDTSNRDEGHNRVQVPRCANDDDGWVPLEIADSTFETAPWPAVMGADDVGRSARA
jgi:hypothetical protein